MGRSGIPFSTWPPALAVGGHRISGAGLFTALPFLADLVATGHEVSLHEAPAMVLLLVRALSAVLNRVCGPSVPTERATLSPEEVGDVRSGTCRHP